MRVWAKEATPVKDFVFEAGWQDVPDDVWAKLAGNRTGNLLRDGTLRLPDGVAAASAAPPVAPAPDAPVELPTKAADVVKLIRSMKTLEELQRLGAVDDNRSSVANAYQTKLEELGFYD